MTATTDLPGFYSVATEMPHALVVLALAQADAERQWDGPELDAEIAKRQLAPLFADPRQMGRYIHLRQAVDQWLAHDYGLAETHTLDELESDVLYTLAELIHGERPCPHHKLAWHLRMLPAASKCSKHALAVAA